MVQVILKLISVILMLIGTIFIYDSRILTKKFFSFGDQNEGTMGLKILGFMIIIVGGIIFYINR